MSLEKLNVFPIVRAHTATLVDARTGRPAWSDRIVHWGIPLFAGAIAYAFDVSLSTEAAGLAIAALAVVVSLLFNLLVVASGLRMANRGSVIFSEARELSKEILVNIEYTVLLSLAAIIAVFPVLLPAPAHPAAIALLNAQLQPFVAPTFLALVVAFGLSMLMVLKRMHFALTLNLEATYDAAPPIRKRLQEELSRFPE